MYNKSPSNYVTRSLACLITLIFSAHFNIAHAENLLQTYELAAKNDPEWQASRESLAANKEFKRIGLSGLLPRIIGSVSYQRVDSDSDGIPTGINGDFGGSLGVAACSLQSLIEGNDAGQCATVENFEALAGFSNCVSNNGGDDTNCYFTTTVDAGTSSTTTTAIQLTQPLFRLDKWFDYRSSLNQVAKAKSEFESARQDLVLKVAETYFNDLRANEEMQFTGLEEKAMEYQLTSTQKRFERGIGSSLGVYEAQSLFDINRATKLLAESVRENAHEDLQKLTRTYQIQADPLPADIPIEAPQPNNVETWVSISKQNSSDLRVAEFAALIAKQDYRKKKSAHAPTLDLGLNYSQLDSNQQTFVTANGKTTTTSIGLTFNVPIYTGGLTSAAESQANHRMREAQFRLDQTRQEIIGSTRKLYRQVESAVLRVNANKVAITSSEKTLSATKRGYERGIRTVAELLQAQREAFQARKNYASARYDYILDTLRLKRISGLLSEQDLDVLNNWLEVVEVNEDGSVSASSLNSELPSSGTMEEKEKLQETQKRQLVRERRLKKKPKPKSLYEALREWGKKE